MLIPEIKDYHSADIENVWTWEPKDLSDVYFVLEFTIGVKGKEAGDIFEIVVATPEGLRKKQNDLPNIQIKKILLIANNYDWKSILDYCQHFINRCSDNSWEKIVEKLNRYFRWEYEDHEFT